MADGAQLFAADLGRMLLGRDDNDEGGDAGGGADDESAAAVEQTYFKMARDMNEVLVSPLHDAAARNNLEGLRAALASGVADGVNAADNAGNTAAHWAAGAGALDCLAYLIELECDLTRKNRLGDTPLHRAVWRNQLAAVQLLVDRGRLDLALRNNDQMLAIDLARDPRVRTALSCVVPFDAVPEIMRVNPDDFEDSFDDDDDDDDDGNDDDDADELERAKRAGFDFSNADDDNDSDGSGGGDDGDVDTLIFVGDTGDRVEIMHVGRREHALGPPPPVPPRHNRPPLSSSAAANNDDDLPPLEPVDNVFEDAD